MFDRRPRRIAALVFCALFAASCATARSDATIRTPAEQLGWQPSLSAVYARIAGAMSKPGRIYNPTISTLDQQGDLTFTTTTKTWIDVATMRARADVAATFSPDNVKRAQWAINGRAYFQTLEYDPTYKREATTCRDSDDPLVSIILGCRGIDERGVTSTIADADYQGRPALALVTLGALHGKGQQAFFTDTLFIDPETYLPIALEGSGRVETLDASGAVIGSGSTGRLTRYENGFVDASSLDQRFFDPVSLGYVDSDPVGAITKPTPDFTAYWLGPDASVDDLPPITIREASVADSAERPLLRYRATITYRPLTDEFGPTMLELQEWRLDEWDEMEALVLSPLRDDPCARQIDIEGKARKATVYGVRSSSNKGTERGCSAGDPDEYVAVVTLGPTVIRISAPDGSPYNTEDAMRAVIKEVTPAN